MSTLMSYAVLHPIHHKHASRALIHINAFTVALRRREVTLREFLSAVSGH